MAERLGARPWQFQGLTGRRKGTAAYCVPCGTWHPTARGLGDAGCPKDTTEPTPGTAAYIPRDRLGTTRKQRIRVPFRVEGVTH